MKKRVLILCTGNSCRSQMAEGLWRHHGGDRWEVSSAGLEPRRLNPRAVAVMAEIGIDIARQTSQSLDESVGQPFDLVVTVCSNAEASCPAFPNATRRLHWPFDDPPRARGSDEEVLQVYRRVRDEIENTVREWLEREPAAPQDAADL
ncbi:MAG: arsenate reductase ArsC [Planctomycetes bacterium]|nr:arsenate reductase ArsC [Planctomycetota bacterium]